MKKIILIVSGIVLFLISSYSVNELSKSRSFQLFGEMITNVEAEEKVVALTFDDGPGENTEEILAILKRHGVKATFYLTGREIEQRLVDAKKIAQEGHEIGNHSYSHKRMIFKSPSFIREEIEKTNALIRETGYEGEITFRPPYGRKLVFLPYYLQQKGMKTILWNIEPDSYPEIAEDAEKIAAHVKENVAPGSIILLHVMYESRQASLAAAEKIIIGLKEKGYQFVTVTELLQYDDK